MTAAAPPDDQAKLRMQSNGMRVRLTPHLRDAISEAARRRGMTASAWMRHAAMTVAMLEGVLFPDVRTDGKRRYARIEGGCLVDVAYLPDMPTPQDEPA
jgi:hypothetical protein